MSAKQPENFNLQEDNKATAGAGNASNPSPHEGDQALPEGTQLLNEKAEKYLREAGNIEDVPDAQDQEEMDETLKKKTGK